MAESAIIIGITGGIGSGKSVVSRILRLKGERVYDCDLEARRLMDADPEIRRRIATEISPKAILTDGSIDRKALAEIVFSDEKARLALNAIVHTAVRQDILLASSNVPDGEFSKLAPTEHSSNSPLRLFVESAILAESGLARLCSSIWLVDGGEDALRIRRVMQRNGWDEQTVRDRIAAQEKERNLLKEYNRIIVKVRNDEELLLIPQIEALLTNNNRIMLRTILSITGKPGLYKIVSQGNRLLIVEDIISGKRQPVHAREKVVSLGDIAMYTQSEDRPLGDILDALYAATNGEKIDIKALDGNDGLRDKFAEFVPDYDRDRVYPSDIRKLFTWYNLLRDAGFEKFASEEDPESPQSED